MDRLLVDVLFCGNWIVLEKVMSENKVTTEKVLLLHLRSRDKEVKSHVTQVVLVVTKVLNADLVRNRSSECKLNPFSC